MCCRSPIMFTLLLLAVVGCGKKSDGEGGGGGGGAPEENLTDPDAEYTIMVYQQKAGDRFEVAKSQRLKMRLELLAKEPNAKPKIETPTDTLELAYSETIDEHPKPEHLPTRVTRDYIRAEQSHDGQKRTLPYSGKTLLIEADGPRYKFRIKDGPQITGEDAESLVKEFPSTGRTSNRIEQRILPKHSVKLNDTWPIDPSLYEEDFSGPIALDSAKSSGTGKLLRVYRKGGRVFAVVELTINLVPRQAEGKLTLVGRVDGTIDGSSGDWKYTIEGTGTIKMTGPRGSATATLEAFVEESNRQVK